MKKRILLGSVTLLIALTGCSYKFTSTPASMKYDGTQTDYSKASHWKKAKLCKELTKDGGDLSILSAAKKAGISKIKHIDTSYEYKKFLFWTYDPKRCIIVYGE
jgi:hypothetical protein